MELRVPLYFFADWYCTRGRQFPWRKPGIDPFKILVAEVLLRQTRAEMVAVTWQVLVSKYANASALAAAEPGELLALVRGLGLGEQRTAALRELAAAVAARGGVPGSIEELKCLPHSGLYTAHAVTCFAFGARVPVVDLNAVRVLSRLAGIHPPADIRRAKVVWELAWSILPPDRVQEHNYGLLDFAAEICRSRRQRCSECPLASGCAYIAVRAGTTDQHEVIGRNRVPYIPSAQWSQDLMELAGPCEKPTNHLW